MSDPSQLGAIDFEGALALLADMTQDFAHGGDLGETLERSLGSIARHVGSEAGSLWLIDSEGQEIICFACVGPSPITGMRLLVNEGGMPTVLYGPGDVRHAHQVDEFVPLAHLLTVTQTLALTILEFCG